MVSGGTDIMRVFRKALYDGVLYVQRTGMYGSLGELRRSEYLSSQEIRGIQTTTFAKLLDSARKNTTFYRGYPNLTDAEALELIGKLPLVEKTQLVSEADKLLSGNTRGPRFTKTTGGSTGQPVTVVKDAKSFGAEIAAAWRGLGWAGISIGDRQARFWGVPGTFVGRRKAGLIDFIGNRARISAFDFDIQSLQLALGRLRRFRPEYFYGYVSVLREFAQFCRTLEVPHGLTPKAIVTTAEILDSDTRRLLQETFGCRVFEEYGCGEVGTIAHECEAGALHITAENVFLEAVALPGVPEGLTEFVVTDLRNHAMPLIRYRLGDLGLLADSYCPCGRKHPIIERIIGRAYDILHNEQGKRFHPEFFIYIFEDAKREGLSCQGFQVEQTGLRSLTVRMTGAITRSAELQSYFTSRVRRSFDPNVEVNFEFVPQLTREPSGKMRVVKSSVPLESRPQLE